MAARPCTSVLSLRPCFLADARPLDGPGGSSSKHFLLSRALSRAHVPSCPLTLSRGGLESPPAIYCGPLCGDELPPPSTRAPRGLPSQNGNMAVLAWIRPPLARSQGAVHPVQRLRSCPATNHHHHHLLISQVCEQAMSPKARGSSLRTWGTLGLCYYLPHSVAPTCPLLGLTLHLPFP